MKTSLLLLVFASCAFAQNTPVPVVQTETGAYGAYSVAISPDGKLVATLDQFGRDLSLWELETSRKIARFRRTSVPIINPPPSPGRSYATASAEPSNGDAIAFAPDGRHVAAFQTDPHSPPVVWEINTGNALGPWKRDAAGKLTLANTSWTPDEIRSWRAGAKRGNPRSAFGLPADTIIQTIATSPDGSLLAVARGPLVHGERAKHDSALELWPLSAPGAPRLLTDDLYSVSGLSFSHNSQWLAAATITKDIGGRITQLLTGDAHLWRVSDSKEIPLDTPTVHNYEWSASRIAFSPDDKQVVATVLREGKPPKGSCNPPCTEPEIVSYEIRTTFFDIASGRAVNSTPLSQTSTSDAEETDSARLVWLSPDGRRAALPGKSIVYVDTLNGRRLTNFRPSPDAPQLGMSASDCDVGLPALGFVAFRLDMTQLAVSDGSALTILDGKTGAIVSGPTQLDDDPQDSTTGLTAAFSPDGKLLAVSGCSSWTGSGKVRLYDSSTLRLRSTIQLDRAADSLTFTPDGALLVTGDYEGLIQLWSTGDGSLAATLVGSQQGWIVFAPNGLFDSSEKGAALLAWRFHGRLVTAGELPEMKLPGLFAQIAAGRRPAPQTSLEVALVRALAPH